MSYWKLVVIISPKIGSIEKNVVAIENMFEEFNTFLQHSPPKEYYALFFSLSSLTF